jgi:hypothetical protein
MSGGHGPHDHTGGNKKTAILIAVLAALLALVEAAGKSAQTEVLQSHIEASNLWNFFQAKTVRRQTVTTFAQFYEAEMKALPADAPAARRDALKAQAEAWRAEVRRFDTEPETKEGRKELMERARAQEAKRDRADKRYHHYEYASAALQLAIVLASAAVVTGATLLTFGALGLGGVALALGVLGWKFPTVLGI